ncbi:UDP-N-acetylglucosamine--N-acetylmuramyl-(pentapeptide) pyrophosphoryl-undecaprenol N-acetylglucosamine transferase, partial [bacterium]|nr:UDP-N-acetylglucosamine--N-acetylmuramyl-(pentapeptide) pyrophosphoryl-undecaprenol N-acetylglucosamine transferase [bacterium]
FLILISFIQSLIILLKYKPDWIISAGGYVQVPLIWASKFFKTKVVLYQSDLKVGLANKLNTSQADLIFTTFSESKEYFKDKSKVQVVGTVLRDEINNVASEIDNSILVLGGGTGASSINSLIKDSLDELTINYKVIQVTGKGKQIDMKHDNYEQHEILLDDYYEKISKAKLVISRAGLSSIMELAYLSKNTILIPLPNSPQESNAEYICERNGAICLNQEGLTKDRFLKEVKKEINLGSNFNEIFKLHGEEIIAKIIYGFK